MSVRRATRGDLERLVDLNEEVQDLHAANMPEFFKHARREDLAEYFDQILADDAARVFVACQGNAVVGYVVLIIRERLETPITLAQRWLYVEQIGVTKEHRGQGHAMAMIEAARAVAAEYDFDRIDLDTWGFNETAQAFFRHAGFRTRSLKMSMMI